MRNGSTPGTSAMELLEHVRIWMPHSGLDTRRSLRDVAKTVFVGGKHSGRQCVNLHPMYSPMGTRAKPAYSLALTVVRDVLRCTFVHTDYAVWGLSLMFSFCSVRQFLHDDFESAACVGGVSVLVTLDDHGSLWMGEGATESLVAMRTCGDFIVFSAGTQHAGVKYSDKDFPQGHWRVFCYGAPCGVKCTGDGLLPPGMCATLI